MNYCFACGRDNPCGLHLQFAFDGKIARATFRPDPAYQGWGNILHGGIIATLLDEAMVYAAYFQGINALTGEIRVRFRKEVPLEETLIVEGWIENARRSLLLTRSRLLNKEGVVLAEGEGKLMRF